MFESDKSDSSSIRSLAIGSIPGAVAINATGPALVWFSLSYSLENKVIVVKRVLNVYLSRIK